MKFQPAPHCKYTNIIVANLCVTIQECLTAIMSVLELGISGSASTKVTILFKKFVYGLLLGWWRYSSIQRLACFFISHILFIYSFVYRGQEETASVRKSSGNCRTCVVKYNGKCGGREYKIIFVYSNSRRVIYIS